MRGRWHYEWFDVAASTVEEGDLYANGATVTEVVVGPHLDPSPFGNVEPGHVLIRCGEGFASKGTADRRIVVGRNATYVTARANPQEPIARRQGGDGS